MEWGNYKPPTMREKDIREEIWKIIDNPQKRKQIEQLLEKQEAILVYQP